MDPQPFVRLSVGQLGLKLPAEKSPRLCHCEIRLGGFPVQTAPVQLLQSTSELSNLDPFTNAAVFSLDESDLKALSTPACFRAPRSRLDVAVYVGRNRGGGRWGGIVAGGMRRRVGVVRVEVGSDQWREGKPVLLRHGWVGVGGKGELHLRVKVEADPRYVFQFDDEVALSPQVVQLHGSTTIRQPIFSCKFIRDRRPSQSDPLLGGQYWWSSEEKETETMMRREAVRKGWKVAIHDLSGSAVAAAFMATPFVPAPGGDRVARSNPGAWLIVRAGGAAGVSDSWQPWARLEAWRDGDAVRLRLHLLPPDEAAAVLVAEARLRSDRGGEFAVDMDRPVDEAAAAVGGGFVMSCRVQGEAPRSSRPPVVQIAARHVACMEDAAVFVALAAAVDLSVKACRPFGRKTAATAKNKPGSPGADPLELDT